MKRLIKKCIIILLICVLLMHPMNYLFKRNDSSYVYHMMNEMYEAEENFDVLFLGSSHTYRTYSTEIIDDMLKCNSFNAGSSSQGMNTSYYLLKEILKYHDVKAVYLDTYFGMSNLAPNDSQVFCISDYMKPSKEKIELLYSNGGIETVLNGLLAFRRNKYNLNFYKNIKYKNLDTYDYSTVKYENEEYLGKGFVYSYDVVEQKEENFYKWVDYNYLSHEKNIVSEIWYDSLINIINLCKNNNIKLVIVNQPMPKESLSYLIGYNNYIELLNNIANEFEIDYWNFDLYKYDMGLSLNCYKDADHLNGKGAEVFSTFFANFVNGVNEGAIDIENIFYENWE